MCDIDNLEDVMNVLNPRSKRVAFQILLCQDALTLQSQQSPVLLLQRSKSSGFFLSTSGQLHHHIYHEAGTLVSRPKPAADLIVHRAAIANLKEVNALTLLC
jgi:hypothetical protein